MKKTVILFTLLLYALTGFTQFYKNNWSALINPAGTNHVFGIYTNGTHYGVLFSDGNKKTNKVHIALVDEESKNTHSITHTFTTTVDILGMSMRNNGCILFIEQLSEKNNQFTKEIKALEFSETDFKNERTIGGFTVKNASFFGKTRLIQSPNGQKTLLFIEHPFTNGSKEEIQLIVYDKTGIEEYNKKLPLHLDSKQNAHNYPQLSNNGSVFFLKKDKDKNAYRYFVYAYNPSINALTHKLIALPNTNITEIRGKVTPSNEFLIGGFTASEPVHAYEGFYLFKFDANCVQKFKTQEQFDEPTFLKFLSKKEYSKNPSIQNYFMDNITCLSTDKIYLTAEWYTEDASSKQTNYAYNDVMLLCFDEKGAFKTAYRHKKKQSVADTEMAWSSYKTVAHRDTLCILHNNLVTVEGSKKHEPVLQFTNVHEKYSLTLRSPRNFNKSADTPFFVTEADLMAHENGFTALFSNLDQDKFKLCFFEFKGK